MKYYFIFIIMIRMFVNSSLHSQTDMEMAEKIHNQVDSIKSDKDLKKVTLQNEEFMENMTDGGGELTGYIKENNIMRVNETIGISYGKYLVDYYYKNSKLIFVCEEFQQYESDSLNMLDYSKTTTTFKGLYYFNESKLIYSTSTGHNRFEEDSSDPAEYYAQESERNIRLIKGKMYK